jgi:hypothetical protein
METAYAREGGPAYASDYPDIGEALYRGLRVDYTYLHPDVLVNRCIVDSDHKLILNNRENREEYRVLFLPGGDTISAAAAAKTTQFYNQGGQVIATGMLPTRSAEFGKDAEVKHAMSDIFGVSPGKPLKADVRARRIARMFTSSGITSIRMQPAAKPCFCRWYIPGSSISR